MYTFCIFEGSNIERREKKYLIKTKSRHKIDEKKENMRKFLFVLG